MVALGQGAFKALEIERRQWANGIAFQNVQVLLQRGTVGRPRADFAGTILTLGPAAVEVIQFS